MIGEVVRYGEGPSALMRVTSINNDRYYGEQYFGGGASAHKWDVQAASQRDLASWRWAHDSRDEWIRGRYAYKPPSHVVLSVLSPQGRSYSSKPLSRSKAYAMDPDSNEAATYERLIVRQGARIVGRWLLRMKERPGNA